MLAERNTRNTPASKMNFRPAIPLSGFPAEKGSGGIAVNMDGTLLASVVSDQNCVYIYSVVDTTADAVVVGATGTAGSGHGQLNNPRSACFVHRNGVDTLLIADFGNDRVVEVYCQWLIPALHCNEEGQWSLGYC